VDDLLGGQFYVNVNQFAKGISRLIIQPTSLTGSSRTASCIRETNSGMTIILMYPVPPDTGCFQV
jgi:hypothetical protein